MAPGHKIRELLTNQNKIEDKKIEREKSKRGFAFHNFKSED